ncbi:MAG: substrate-binding domain-containing protein [Lautropia sp.]
MIALATLAPIGAHCADIKVLAVVIYKTSMDKLTAEFERQTGHRAEGIVMSPNPLVDAYRKDGGFDVVMTIKPTVEKFVADGIARGDTRRTVARSGIGIAVPAGTPRPAIATSEELERTFRQTPTISYSKGPSGVYVDTLLRRMKIENTGNTKFVIAQGEPVGAIVARKAAMLGMQQMSELIGIDGIDVIGPLPADVQHFTIVDAALHPAARSPQVALAFLEFLKTPEAIAIIRKAGIDTP